MSSEIWKATDRTTHHRQVHMSAVTLAHNERFGVQRGRNILITTPGGEEVQAVVCSLTTDGTLDEIISRFHRSRHEVAFSPEVIEAFKRDSQGVLLEQEHATMLLRKITSKEYDVVCLEMDEHWRLDELVLKLSGDPHVWLASDCHQIMVPAALFV